MGQPMRLAAALAVCLAATPAAAYWDCYPVRAIRSGPMLHHTHFIAHHARTTTHPTLRRHAHHHRHCHVHLHCVWVDDGGPAGDGAGGGYGAEGYGFGSGGEGDAGGFGGFGGGEGGGGLPYAPLVPIQPVNIDIPCYFPPPCIPPIEYPPVTPPIAQVPETSTWVMLALGFAFLFGVGRKHASKQLVI